MRYLVSDKGTCIRTKLRWPFVQTLDLWLHCNSRHTRQGYFLLKNMQSLLDRLSNQSRIWLRWRRIIFVSFKLSDRIPNSRPWRRCLFEYKTQFARSAFEHVSSLYSYAWDTLAYLLLPISGGISLAGRRRIFCLLSFVPSIPILFYRIENSYLFIWSAPF